MVGIGCDVMWTQRIGREATGGTGWGCGFGLERESVEQSRCGVGYGWGLDVGDEARGMDVAGCDGRMDVMQ